MNNRLEMAEAVRQAAGWHKVPKQVDSAVEFELEGHTTFKLIQPSDHLAAFTAKVIICPADVTEADELARRLGQLAAAAFCRRRSTLSLSQGHYLLHLAFEPSLGLAEIPSLCSDFLNDLDWWRHNSSRP
jgi:hypothetical protein